MSIAGRSVDAWRQPGNWARTSWWPVSMRADDHQLQKGVYISRWQKLEGPREHTAEGTGHAFVPVDFMPASEIARDPTCQMQRP